MKENLRLWRDDNERKKNENSKKFTKIMLKLKNIYKE